MTAPRVTVLIPARDEERWIAECLDAVARQQYPHDRIEVIVVIATRGHKMDGECRRNIYLGDEHVPSGPRGRAIQKF